MAIGGNQLLTGGVSGLKVGDSFGGGIVFWVDGNGGGMVVATSPLPADAIKTRWDLFSDVSGASGTAIDTGLQNNLDILAAGGCSAVDYVWDYSAGGKSDWFLPSQGELQEVHNTVRTLITYPTDNLYWSSTENPASPASQAMALRPWNGSVVGYSKGSALYCLPVRRFTSEEDPTLYLNYRFELYTQDANKYSGGRLRLVLSQWNGSGWDEFENTTYGSYADGIQYYAPCIAVPKYALVKATFTRVGNLFGSHFFVLNNRRVSDLQSVGCFSAYGSYGSLCASTTAIKLLFM